jgi:soluble lytic murein transglycosylase-like protein
MTTKSLLRKREKRSKTVWALFAAAAAVLVWCSLADATGVYMYRDEKGVVHFTDAPTDRRYRPFKIKTRIQIGSGSVRLDPELLMPYIKAASKKYRLDPALITAVIRVESAFNPNAVSWAGAQGLMQLMPGTARLMQVNNVFSARENIYGGSRYLRDMLDRFNGDVKLALAAYNCGPERVAKVNRIPNIRETQAYVKRVLYYYKHYKRKS